MAGVRVSPLLIGRRSELESLTRALVDGRAGVARAVVVRGEAGIGKTRLVEEALRASADVREDGIRRVVGLAPCVEGAPPLFPLRRLLHDLHVALGDGLIEALAAAPGVVRTLGLLMPEIDAPVGEGASRDEPASSDLVAEAIELLIETLGEHLHVVLVLEDLQWADAVTGRVATLLAATVRGTHVTVVMTYRTDEHAHAAPVEPGLVALDARRRIETIDLRRLSPGEVEEQVAAIADRRLSRRELDAIADRSGGVPFLVEELVAADGVELPSALRDLLLLRFRAASAPTQNITRLLAIGTGGRVEHETLVAVAAMTDGDLEAALRDAVDTGLVVTDETGYRLRHALLHEAVYADILPAARRAGHRAYAEAIDRSEVPSFPSLAEVAAHRVAAGDPARAFDAALRALSHRDSELDPAAAGALWRRLADLWSEADDPRLQVGASRAEVLRRAGEAFWQAGEYAEARTTMTAAVAEPGPHDAVERAAALWWCVLTEGWFTNRLDRGMLDEAEDLLADIDEPRAQSQLARVLSTGGRGDLARQERAVAVARASGDPDALVLCLANLSIRLTLDGDHTAAAEAAAEATALGGAPAARQRAGVILGAALMAGSDYDGAERVFEETRRDAFESGRRRGFGAMATAARSEALLALGRPEESASLVRQALQLLTVAPDRSWAMRIRAQALLWAGRIGDYEETRRDASEILAEIDEPGEEARGWAWLDLLALLIRRADERDAQRRTVLTERLIRPAADLLAAGGDADGRREALPLAAWALGVMAPLAEPHAALRRAVETAASGQEKGIHPSLAAFARAELSTADDAGTPARVDAWAHAVELLRTQGGLPVQFARLAQLRLAEAEFAAADRVAAQVTLETLKAEASAQGVELVARWAEELAARAGLSSAPGTRLESLTERETQVLALVARGLTNPQIGRELFISPKTVSIHVSSILMKTGTANRIEAAAIYRDAMDASTDVD